MIENITIGDISAVLIFAVAFISAVGFLYNNFKKWLISLMDKQTANIDFKIDQVNDRLDKVDMSSSKNFIVRCIADFDKGITLSETELERFWEEFSNYECQGGNSYIKQKVEKLQREGKI